MSSKKSKQLIDDLFKSLTSDIQSLQKGGSKILSAQEARNELAKRLAKEIELAKEKIEKLQKREAGGQFSNMGDTPTLSEAAELPQRTVFSILTGVSSPQNPSPGLESDQIAKAEESPEESHSEEETSSPNSKESSESSSEGSEKMEKVTPENVSESVVGKLKEQYGYSTPEEKAKVHATAWKISKEKVKKGESELSGGKLINRILKISGNALGKKMPEFNKDTKAHPDERGEGSVLPLDKPSKKQAGEDSNTKEEGLEKAVLLGDVTETEITPEQAKAHVASLKPAHTPHPLAEIHKELTQVPGDMPEGHPDTLAWRRHLETAPYKAPSHKPKLGETHSHEALIVSEKKLDDESSESEKSGLEKASPEAQISVKTPKSGGFSPKAKVGGKSAALGSKRVGSKQIAPVGQAPQKELKMSEMDKEFKKMDEELSKLPKKSSKLKKPCSKKELDKKEELEKAMLPKPSNYKEALDTMKGYKSNISSAKGEPAPAPKVPGDIKTSGARPSNVKPVEKG